MGVQRNSSKYLSAISSFIFLISNVGGTEILNVTVGPSIPVLPGQVPWVGPLRVCDLNVYDSELDDCIKNIVQDISGSWANGIPDLGIPPMDPFHVDQINFNQRSPTIEFQGNLTNVDVTGFNVLTDVQLGLNATAGYINFTVSIPMLRMSGTYKAYGRAGVIPFYGQGPFYTEFYNFTFFGTTHLRNEIVGNTTILTSYDLVTDFTIADFDFNLQDFGGLIVGPLINGAANLGRNILLQSMKPDLNQKLTDLFGSLLDTFLPTQQYMSGILTRG